MNCCCFIELLQTLWRQMQRSNKERNEDTSWNQDLPIPMGTVKRSSLDIKRFAHFSVPVNNCCVHWLPVLMDQKLETLRNSSEGAYLKIANVTVCVKSLQTLPALNSRISTFRHSSLRSNWGYLQRFSSYYNLITYDFKNREFVEKKKITHVGKLCSC